MTTSTESNQTFHVVIKGEQKGPYTLNDLIEMQNKGIVNSSTMVWKERDADWQALAHFTGKQGTIPPPLPGSAPTVPPLPPEPQLRSESLGFTIIGLCFVHGLLIWAGFAFGVLAENFRMFEWLIPIMVWGLIYRDAKLLGMGAQGDRTPKGRRRAGPFFWLLLTGFVPLAIPFYLYRRRLYAARNLLMPGLAAFVLSWSGIAVSALSESSAVLNAPPEVSSSEVVDLVKKVINQNAVASCVEIVSPVEVRYDATRQRRIGRAGARMVSGDVTPVYFSVQWHSAETEEFFVRVARTESGLE